MDHPNIVRLHEVYDGGNSFYLVLELCTGGELYDDLINRAQYVKIPAFLYCWFDCFTLTWNIATNNLFVPLERYGEEDAAKLFHQMVASIAYVHRRGIAHRDLKVNSIYFEIIWINCVWRKCWLFSYVSIGVFAQYISLARELHLPKQSKGCALEAYRLWCERDFCKRQSSAHQPSFNDLFFVCVSCRSLFTCWLNHKNVECCGHSVRFNFVCSDLSVCVTSHVTAVFNSGITWHPR